MMAIKTMTSRERVLKTLNHQEPDHVPFNLSLTVDIYHRLREHLGLPVDLDKPFGVWTEVSPSLDLLDVMGVDIYYTGLGKPSNWRPPQTLDGLLYDEWGIGRAKVERPDGSFYYEMVKHPLAEASLNDIEDYPWPDPADPGRLEGLRERVLEARKNTDKAIMVKFSNAIWEQSWWLYGMQPWMIDLMETPAICTAIMDKVTDVAVALMQAGMREIGDLVDIVRLSGEDLGTQTAPMISPRLFESLVRPRFERLWNCARKGILEKNPVAKLMVHSCGNVRPFIPSWIEMGLDILDPIQPRARGMEPENLKRDFGEHLVFHGGIDLQYVLPFGTADDVCAEVRRYMRALAPGGGYIVAPAHNVQSDVPPENLVAIRDAIAEYGRYPIQ
jgi:uroporphyrinogen decarboxylase